MGGLKPSQLLPQHGPCSAEVVFQVFHVGTTVEGGGRGGTGLCSLAFGIRDKMQVIYKEMTRDEVMSKVA